MDASYLSFLRTNDFRCVFRYYYGVNANAELDITYIQDKDEKRKERSFRNFRTFTVYCLLCRRSMMKHVKREIRPYHLPNQ